MNITTLNKQFDFSIPTLIVGMGGTGLSCARYLKQRGCSYAFADNRKELSIQGEIKDQFSPLEVLTGDFKFEQFINYKQIIVSPGISIRSELFTSLIEKGCFVLGDIEIFSQVINKPVIAITGSNGKSTVTTLVEKITQECGVKSIAGGNLGIPALDLLATNSDLYILELSSFQLETSYSLKTLSATVLNVSEDHMDRYNDLDDYRRVKESIYKNTENAVVNIDEKITFQRIESALAGKDEKYTIITFGEEPSADKEPSAKNKDPSAGKEPSEKYYLRNDNVLMKGKNEIIKASKIKLKGSYNYINILAALALLEPLKLNMQKMLAAITEYSGLAHRCEWVAQVNGIEFYNDSKGTNTGATIAAIDGFEAEEDKQQLQRKIILIAGGIAKGADFTEMGRVIEKKIKATVLMGVDSQQIKNSALNAGVENSVLYSVDTMSEAVSMAYKLAITGDTILLSPACASFDMYQNYMKRGEDFKEKVLTLSSEFKTKLEINSELKHVS